MILLIDNYDSFAHNLARYFTQLEQEVEVRRNDEITIEQIESLHPQALILSPGPCGPNQAGICLEAVTHFAGQIPMLGVCLGHQVIATAFGGDVLKSGQPVHGQTSQVFHENESVFAGIDSPFEACRYHSLIVSPETLPKSLKIIGKLEDGTIMGIQHLGHPIVGVQFHPESILSQSGYQLLANFLEIASIDQPAILKNSPIEFPVELISEASSTQDETNFTYPFPGKPCI